ncbi:DUF4037 domain-containing protein [Cellulosimicrobium sp. Marseille-Q4280]|uniref:DUF4037 domain-containing protein n=1 Tax=Cellulosimicrobium sp. Marseille-Q4280 TaxID=2937992 RepID=UPI00203EAA1B|nr:DUF4037 domain-containing protein [Cellulosimicrobium sp. Marseille-Q4280]
MDTGADLARRYDEQVVAPLVRGRWPGLPYATARLGSGSDVLGLDDPTSRDHDWGLRLTLLVDEPMVEAVDALLDAELPATFDGLPTRFATTWAPHGPHQVEVAAPGAFVTSRLGVDATRPLSVADWLALTGQAVLEVTAGPVFTDTDGRLTAARERLARYPEDVWRYVVATDWVRLGQELPFVGRTGDRGDDLGSRVVAARLVRVAMHLGFLLECRWPPYAKWFGTLFAQLPRAGALAPALRATLAAEDWRAREAAICRAVEGLHALQAEVGLPVAESALGPFWGRPYRGVGPVPEAVTASVVDPEVRALPLGVGSVEQWVDDVDVLMDPDRRVAAARAVVVPAWDGVS